MINSFQSLGIGEWNKNITRSKLDPQNVIFLFNEMNRILFNIIHLIYSIIIIAYVASHDTNNQGNSDSEKEQMKRLNEFLKRNIFERKGAGKDLNEYMDRSKTESKECDIADDLSPFVFRFDDFIHQIELGKLFKRNVNENGVQDGRRRSGEGESDEQYLEMEVQDVRRTNKSFLFNKLKNENGKYVFTIYSPSHSGETLNVPTHEYVTNISRSDGRIKDVLNDFDGNNENENEIDKSENRKGSINKSSPITPSYVTVPIELFVENPQGKAIQTFMNSIRSSMIEPELNKDYVRGVIHFGGKDVIAPLHVDKSRNVLIQLSGRKKFRLFQSSRHLELQLYPVIHGSRRQSQIDVTTEGYDIDASLEIVLEPGDVLFLPPFVAHEVEYLSSGVTLSIVSPSLSERMFAGVYPNIQLGKDSRISAEFIVKIVPTDKFLEQLLRSRYKLIRKHLPSLKQCPISGLPKEQNQEKFNMAVERSKKSINEMIKFGMKYDMEIMLGDLVEEISRAVVGAQLTPAFIECLISRK